MSISFEFRSEESTSFKDRGILKIGSLTLHNVRSHSYGVGVLKLLGKIEDISDTAGEVIHVNRASLIKQYRTTGGDPTLSDGEILTLIRSCCHAERNEASGGEYVRQEEKLRRIATGPLAGVAIRSGVLEGTEGQHLRAIRVMDDLAVYMKSALQQSNDNTLHAALEDQFKSVRLMNRDGSWKHPALISIGNRLVPSSNGFLQNCADFIDATVVAAKKNPYLLAAIDNLDERQLGNLRERARQNGVRMIQYIVPYAMALNALTRACARDIELFDKLDRLWTIEKNPHNVRDQMNVFGVIKYYTLGHLSGVKKAVRTGRMARDANRRFLKLNIMEAVLADGFLGNSDNAQAGRMLVRHPVGGKSNPLTGSGPASVSKQKGYAVLEIRPDLPKEWADLYTVWNLTFCSIADTFPLLVPTLLMPIVNDYSSNPEGYMYHRVIGLYIYFQFGIFRGIGGEPAFLQGWNSPEVTRAMGQANAASAYDYHQQVLARKRQPGTEMQ